MSVAFAPSLMAQNELPAASTGVTNNVVAGLVELMRVSAPDAQPEPAASSAEAGIPAFHLVPDGDANEIFGTSSSEAPKTLAATPKAMDVALFDSGQETPAQSRDETATPPPKPVRPSLQDLGFAPDQAMGDAAAQARLDKRTHMLKVHQTLGLITLVPLIATVFAAGGAGGHGSVSARNLHGALGIVTAGLYITTASFAIRAPSIPGMEVRGPIRVHKVLAWVHGVGMILTPILGAMARSQLDSGEKVHGIAAAHGAVADITVLAYAAAIGSVAIKF